MTSVQHQSAAPLAGADRLHALDLIRGIAVLGILLANVTAFGHVDLAYYWPPALPGGGNAADRLIWLAQFVVVDGKFRGLFTLLFGAGLILFIDRAGGGRPAVVLQMRRLGWFILLFRGDILFGYACAGFVALLFVRASAERLLAIGLIWAALGGMLQVLAYITPAMIEAGGSGTSQVIAYYADYWQAQLADAAVQGRIMADGSAAEILRYRVVAESHLLGSNFQYAFFETIPLTLMGMGLYRMGLFAPVDGPLFGRGLALAAVAAGLALNLAAGLWVWANGFPPFMTQLAFFGLSNLANLPLLLGGIWLFAHWAAGPHESWLAERLTQAGRMAFSNYIGTSLVMMLLFNGWAGGLFGQLDRAEMLLVVLLGWLLMLRFSGVWLETYRFGPLEWLWRCLTYWQRVPLRR
jgi:uncharacterized protein